LAATKTGTTYSVAIDLPPIQVAEPMNPSPFRQGAGAKEARNIWPPMNADDTELGRLTGPIIGSALTVSNTLGAGFLEKVLLSYQRKFFAGRGDSSVLFNALHNAPHG
jgi:hypothetical protein